MSATRRVERACRGCFRAETTGFLRFAMRATGMRIGNANNHSYSTRSAPRCMTLRTTMTTLTTPPVSTVIERLFAEAEANEATVRSQMNDIPPDERARMRSSTTDYKTLYTLMKDAALAVSRETATL